MFRCLRYDNRQSTALCITQHYTVSTCFQFQLDSFSVLFDQQICTVHILSFGLVLESLGGFLWFLGQVLDFSSLRQEQPSIRRLPNSKGVLWSFSQVSYPSVFTFQNISIASGNVKKEPKDVPVPLSRLSYDGIIGSKLVSSIYTTHVCRVKSETHGFWISMFLLLFLRCAAREGSSGETFDDKRATSCLSCHFVNKSREINL